MRYSLKQLAVFDAIATCGSVSQAADKLALTQSAASMALSQLEKVLGRPLFERKGRKLALTQWGHWLLPKAKQLLLQAQQIEHGFYEQHVISGEIAVGASQTAAEHLVPDLISLIDSEFPELRIGLNVANTDHVINGVLDYRYDLGIIEGRCDDSRLQQDIWCHDHLLIVSSCHHPFANLEKVSLSQLEQAKWVLREHGSGTRQIIDSAMHGVIEDLDVWREYEHVPVLRTLVSNGPYLTCLPYLDVAKHIESGELVSLNVPEIKIERTLSFVWRTNSVENPLRDCLLREAKRLIKQSSIKM